MISRLSKTHPRVTIGKLARWLVGALVPVPEQSLQPALQVAGGAGVGEQGLVPLGAGQVPVAVGKDDAVADGEAVDDGGAQVTLQSLDQGVQGRFGLTERALAQGLPFTLAVDGRPDPLVAGDAPPLTSSTKRPGRPTRTKSISPKRL